MYLKGGIYFDIKCFLNLEILKYLDFSKTIWLSRCEFASNLFPKRGEIMNNCLISNPK